MKSFLIFVSFLAVGKAQYPDARPQYGAPSPFFNPYLPPQPSSDQENEVKDEPVDLKVFRHVFVHSVPEDKAQESKIRRIKAPGGDEKHVSIIFVKAPAPAPPTSSIIDVPNDGGRQTLVYVLLKKAQETPDVKFSAPAPTKASKPEVYFIRYKDGQQPSSTPATPKSSYGNANAGAPQPFSGYGAPSQEGYNKK